MHDLSLEQPIFGANSIKGKVRGSTEFAFELKFSKGGAIEFGQAMRNAAKSAQTNAQQAPSQSFPTYTPGSNQYYQTPVDNVFQPNYPVGFVLPTQTFSQAPPPGFIYACDVPPPYPGIVATASVPGASVAPNPGAFVAGATSLQPAIYPDLQMNGGYQGYPTQATTQPNASYPTAPGFNVGADYPPTYDEATKKKQ